MYREQYGRQTAAAMYQVGRPFEEVAQMLAAEGATAEQAGELADTYYQQYRYRQVIANKKKLKESKIYRLVGLVFVVGSLLLSFLTYLLIGDGQSFLVYYGLISIGSIASAKGLLDEKAAKAALATS